MHMDLQFSTRMGEEAEVILGRRIWHHDLYQNGKINRVPSEEQKVGKAENGFLQKDQTVKAVKADGNQLQVIDSAAAKGVSSKWLYRLYTGNTDNFDYVAWDRSSL